MASLPGTTAGQQNQKVRTFNESENIFTGHHRLKLYVVPVNMNSIDDRKPLQTDRPSLVSFCYFQAESSPGLSEADVEEGLAWHVRGLSRLYLP